MTKESAIKLFEQKQIRSIWDDEEEKWYFSVIDVIEVLTGSERPRKYWSDLKSKLIKEGSELSEKIGQLKMQAEDGKMRIAGNTRKEIEEKTGKKVVSTISAKKLLAKKTKKLNN
jgi:hypothetical protein